MHENIKHHYNLVTWLLSVDHRKTNDQIEVPMLK